MPVGSQGLIDRYGPWAVVTGASAGIGQAFAKQLADSGFGVVLVARRQAALEATAHDLAPGNPSRIRVVAVDLSRPNSIDELSRAVADLDVGLFVASAGFGSSGPLIDQPLAIELEMIDVNCRAVAALAHEFGSRFAARRRGGLVLMSSLFAFQGVPGAANYAATKAYVQTLAEGLRAELRPHGVDVIASAPGPITSAFAARANMQMGLTQTPDVVATSTLAALGHRTTIRPGWLAKLLEGALTMLPRWGRTRILAQIMSGMTKQHDHSATQAA